MHPQASEGGCRCGRVRFRVAGPPLFTAACHCRGCQRMTASAFSLSAGYPADRFEVIVGETAIGGLHGASRHHFCGHCMSWLFTRPEGVDDFVNVRAMLLDTPPAEPPFLETCTDAALSWVRTGAVHRFAGFPPPDRFAPLLAEFAQRHGHASEGTGAAASRGKEDA